MSLPRAAGVMVGRRQRSVAWHLRQALAYVLLITGAVVMLVPFLYMVSTSLKSMLEAFQYPPTWLPRQFMWSNYLAVWSKAPLARVALNSIRVSGMSTVGQVLTCSLAGYAFARLRFPGRGPLFMVFIATMMVPTHVTLIPTFVLFKTFGWINTHYPLVVPAWFGGAFGIFLVRQFFLTIPQDLADAARVDGCNPARAYWQIFMPLAKPVLGTLAIFTFFNSWNDLLGPLIYLRDTELMTFPVALASFGGRYLVDLPLLMAASVISIVPTLILFLVLQKYFVQGIVLSGLKV